MTNKGARKALAYWASKYAFLFLGIATFYQAVEDRSVFLVFVAGLMLTASLELAHRYGVMIGKDAVMQFCETIVESYAKEENDPIRPDETEKEYEFRRIASACTINAILSLKMTIED